MFGGVTLLVSHRFSTVRTADMIIVLDKGALVQLGTHEQLIRANGLYRRLYKMQAERYG